MTVFSFIKLEGKKYPTVIMGEDNFTGWFGKKFFKTEDEREIAYRGAVETAYANGVRGFSISPHPTLIKVLKSFKKEHPEIVCIANPHWQSHYYVGNKSLWLKENLNKLASTEKYYTDSDLIKDYPRLNDLNVNDRFSDDEILLMNVNEGEYLVQLTKFQTFCDFCLVGNLGHSAFILLGREDIIEREIEMVRGKGLIPLGMCQGGGLAFSKMDSLNVAGHWGWINSHYIHPNREYALREIRQIKKPITAYKIFTSPDGFNFNKSMAFIKSIAQIKSIVVGVDNKEQAEETFRKLHKYWV